MRSDLMTFIRNTALAMGSLLLLAVFTGCPDDTGNMAQQIAGGNGGGGAVPVGDGGTPAIQGGGEDSAQPGEMPAGMKQPGETPAEGEEEAVEGEYTGPEVEITVKEVKAKYPEYEGPGRYNIHIEVLGEKNPDTGESYGLKVWELIGYDKDGNVVLKDKSQTRIPDHKPGSIFRKDIYCEAMPVAFELQLTELTASKTDEGAVEGEGGRGGGTGAGGGRGYDGGGGDDGSGRGYDGGGGSESEGGDGGVFDEGG